jgi:hypothetical protein
MYLMNSFNQTEANTKRTQGIDKITAIHTCSSFIGFIQKYFLIINKFCTTYKICHNRRPSTHGNNTTDLNQINMMNVNLYLNNEQVVIKTSTHRSIQQNHFTERYISRRVWRDQREVIRIRKSNQDKQHNGQKKKYKRTNNDLQNIHIKLKIK